MDDSFCILIFSSRFRVRSCSKMEALRCFICGIRIGKGNHPAVDVHERVRNCLKNWQCHSFLKDQIFFSIKFVIFKAPLYLPTFTYFCWLNLPWFKWYFSDGEADLSQSDCGALVHHHLRHLKPDLKRDSHERGDDLPNLFQSSQRHRLPSQGGAREDRCDVCYWRSIQVGKEVSNCYILEGTFETR